jgi:redox-regulated HSP33 family molecular chaperone
MEENKGKQKLKELSHSEIQEVKVRHEYITTFLVTCEFCVEVFAFNYNTLL